jgi:hypothetical protein
MPTTGRSHEVDGYEFDGPTRYDKLFTGLAVEMPKEYAGTTGTEGIGPEDTFDGDYGRLLDKFYVKGMASQSTPNWNQIASFLESMQRLRNSVGFAG